MKSGGGGGPSSPLDPLERFKRDASALRALGTCYFELALGAVVHVFAPGRWVCSCGERDCTPEPVPKKRRGWRAHHDRKRRREGPASKP